MIDRNTLLGSLPPYEDQWLMVNPDQDVDDIIAEVLQAHKRYASYYDQLAPYFAFDDTKQIADALYKFCKSEIRYREETKEDQTTALPTGILVRGYGDCKHYSSFTGGILDALNRAGYNIKWKYRFASYDPDDKTPHHVFVVVYTPTEELWIDPTPKANQLTPEWVTDKTVKSMALRTNIAGVSTIGISSLTVTPKFDGDNNINWDGTNKYAGVWNPYMGLSMYRDLGGDRDINQTSVAAQINAAIAEGPHPGHAVTPDFVKWVYNANIRSWNFYYPGGVAPGFDADGLLPATWPRLVITADGRLTFDRDIKIDDWRNAEIHLLTAWAQALINQYDPTPYPVKPQHLKEFSQLLYGNVNDRNLFTERRGASFFAEVGKALEDAVNFVKEKVLTVVGFIPRNAFLGLVGINAFNFAGNLWDNIQAGKWEQIADRWRLLGGNPDKLYNTIEDGKEKNPILGQTGAYIGADPATDTAALLAAAAPIIAALIAFLDKEGKAKEVLSATKAFLQTAYPNIDLSAYGFLDQPGGTLLTWEGDPAYDENKGAINTGELPGGSSMDWLKKNPLPVAAGAAVAAYFVTKKKGQKPNYIIPAIVGVATFFLLNQSSSTGMTTAQKLAALQKWADTLNAELSEKTAMKQLFATMTPAEIDTVYNFIANYYTRNIPVPEGSALYNEMLAISEKYNVFT